jgi:DMSO/TMAO reductase YedYZ heme-binding membrane subunit
MTRTTLAKAILSFVLLFGSIMSFFLDWSGNHLLNPLWHPHAKFHSAILLFLFAGVALTATWLLWNSAVEPKIAIKTAAALSASYWTPFFFVPYLLPGSSYWAGIPGHEPHLRGMVFYPNLLVVGLFLLLTLIACWIGTSQKQEQAS